MFDVKVVYILLIHLLYIQALPEKGIFRSTITSEDYGFVAFVKTLYKNSTIKVSATPNTDCSATDESTHSYFQWVGRGTLCFDLYKELLRTGLPVYLDKPSINLAEGTEYYLSNYDLKEPNSASGDLASCTDPDVFLTTFIGNQWKVSTTNENVKIKSKEKRQIEMPVYNHGLQRITNIPEDATYIFIFQVKKMEIFNPGTVSFDITVDMKSPYGYLSAHEYPLLTVYMVLCIVYVLLALIWVVLSLINFNNLNMFQHFIGVLIFFSLIQGTIFYCEFLTVNTTGENIFSAAKSAELFSALKRSTFLVFIILISLGYDIVKPKNKAVLIRVTIAGILYFILAIVESFSRQDTSLFYFDDQFKRQLFTSIPLFIMELVLSLWIFIGLSYTMRSLKNNDLQKLSLYQYISATVTMYFVASLMLIVWDGYVHKVTCLKEWNKLWILAAAWEVLFTVVLLSFAFFLRPSKHFNRFLYHPKRKETEVKSESVEILKASEKETDEF